VKFFANVKPADFTIDRTPQKRSVHAVIGLVVSVLFLATMAAFAVAKGF
jgi:hypothetical protein